MLQNIHNELAENPMPPTWSHDDVFPIIARIIRESKGDEHGFVTHDEIANVLLTDSAGAALIQAAQLESADQHSADWVARNMVSWFSQRITVEQSDWSDAFDRKKIDGKWAYKLN